jgi:hypothetical protein
MQGGPPPLRPFGLVLHHDGRWTHEGVPVLNRRLREAFDRSVRFVPAQRGVAGAQRGEAACSTLEPAGVFVVQLGRFRGQIEVEEAAFFVRDFDATTGAIRLSDGSSEALDAATLRLSACDGAGLCRVKRALAPGGLLARFTHAAWSELAGAIEGPEQGPWLRLAERSVPLPDAVVRALG